MGALNYIRDTLVNVVAGLGTGRDKASQAQYISNLGLTDQQLVAFFRSSWLARKIVTIPAFDSFRKWRNWQAEGDEITLLEAEEKRLQLRQKIYEARWKARLFGWCAIYISDGTADTTLPLDPAKIGKQGIEFLNVMPKWHFTNDNLTVERDPRSPNYGEPTFYKTAQLSTAAGLLLPQIDIHPSRLVIFRGDPTPDNGEIVGVTISPIFMQGESVLQGRHTAIRDADATAANVASLIYEAKVDVISVPDLMESLRDPAYAERLLGRFSLANTAKGINGTLILDAMETYTQKSANLSGLEGLVDKFLQMCAGASDIPVTRLLGVSPGGMNATGEHDLRNYYDFVQALQENEITPALQILDECLIYSAFGNRPKEVHYIWASLWQISDKERTEIGKVGSEIIKNLHDTGLYPPEALANAGTNFMVENSVLPGFGDMIDEAGGLPDFDFEPEIVEPVVPARPKLAVVDGVPKSLYVCRYVINHAAVAAHYRRQGITIADPANLHATIIYSEVPLDWFSVGEAWQSEIKIYGGARDHDVFGKEGGSKHMVLLIKSNEFEWRHANFLEKGAISDFPEYQPHITILGKNDELPDLSTVEPYRGELIFGPEMFEETK